MKKNLSLIISFIGIVSIAGGLLLIKTLENPNEFILTFHLYALSFFLLYANWRNYWTYMGRCYY